jgi:hypothetical protein
VASLCKNVTFPPPITHRLWKNTTFASRISVVCAKTPPFLAGGRIPYAKTPPLRILGSSVIGRIAERLSLADSVARTSPESQDRGEIGWRRQMHGANVAGGPVGWAAILLLRCQLRLALRSNTRSRLRLCKRPWCPLCWAGHDMSGTGEPYLKTGDQAWGRDPNAVVSRQQNRRVLLPFGPTSSCYRVEQ